MSQKIIATAITVVGDVSECGFSFRHDSCDLGVCVTLLLCGCYSALSRKRLTRGSTFTKEITSWLQTKSVNAYVIYCGWVSVRLFMHMQVYSYHVHFVHAYIDHIPFDHEFFDPLKLSHSVPGIVLCLCRESV